MTQENAVQVIDIEASFEDRACAALSDVEYAELMAYIAAENPELALSTAQRFFELFLYGNNVDDIHDLNVAFPKSSIQWCRFKYNWDRLREEHMMKLYASTAQKVMKAQLDTTSLLADILSASAKKNGDKINKYLQTGNENDLAGALSVKCLKDLVKTAESLQKITNQDKKMHITKEENVNVNITSTDTAKTFSSETSAKILEAVAAEKRKNNKH